MELVIIAVLAFLGILLLAVEVMLIPGFGITGVAGVALLASAVAYAFMAIGVSAGWLVLAIAVVLIVLLVMWAAYGRTFKRLALNNSIQSSTKNPATDTLKAGDEGVAVTRLALVGEAAFGDAQVEVTSADGFIDEGEAIFVSRIDENSVFVKRK